MLRNLALGVAVALLLAAAITAAPALANYGIRHGHTVYAAPNAVYAGPRSQRLANALGGWNRGDPNDPYWDPCLSYYRSWGPGACGR
jgi:hypothetical protein